MRHNLITKTKYFKMEYLSRVCQQNAFNCVIEKLTQVINCIVKMFCGTGKTRVMVELINYLKKDITVVVFPSLLLIQQFSDDYLGDSRLQEYKQLNVSSLDIKKEDKDSIHIESTTDPIKIKNFIMQKGRKIICVSYQSLAVLLDNLDGNKIGICLFDEAHHTTSIENAKLIYYEPYKSLYEKQVFFTATPVNENGIVMFDCVKNEEGKYGNCGPLAFEYTYLQGVKDNILKPFDIRVDMFTECSVISIYETIARAILTTGNSRVLTFHADVSEESKSETSVLRFVDECSFKTAFNKVLNEEFPNKKGKYKKITFRGLTGESKPKDKIAVLAEFDRTTDDEIFILSSCRTVGEGTDTKRANMDVFVDPKTSYAAIIQNIGRIDRIDAGNDRNATVLIPVYVDRTKYNDCGDDKEKKDQVIREELVNGNYYGIAKICAALKEEDTELYDIIVRYPSNFTPVEREKTLKEQKCRLDDDEDKRKYDCDVDEMIEEGEPVEIHTSSVDEPIVRHNIDDDTNASKVKRLFQVEEENDDGELETVYYPIVSENGKRIAKLDPPKKQGRPRIDFHTNDEIKMLWSIKDGEDFGNNICSQVIECQVERVDSVERWKEMLLEATEYMDTEKKRPNSRTPLGGWVNKQIEYYDSDINKCKYIMKNPNVHQSWSETRTKYSDYLCIDRVKNWKNMLSKVIEYMDNNNKPPSQINTSKDIKNLGKWISHNKTNYNDDITKSRNLMKNSEVRQLWCETVDKYSTLLGDDVTIWKITHDKVVDYIKTHKKRPNKRDKNKDIQSMGNWILTSNSNYKNNIGTMRDPEVHKLWTETRRQYSEYLCLDNIADWKKINIQLIEYMDVNKKRPSSSAGAGEEEEDDDLRHEKMLATWISNNNRNYDEYVSKSKERMKIPEVHELWRKTLTDYSEYLGHDITKWKNMLNKVIEYMNLNKKSPSYSDKNKDIKRMGNWISTQKTNYNTDIKKSTSDVMRKEELHALWKQTLLEYEEYLSNIPDWKKMHNTVVEFIKKNKQKPRNGIKDTDEGRMASWISTHNGNYDVKIEKSSGMMTNSELHKIWSDTLAEYSEYLLCIDTITKWKIDLIDLLKFEKQNNRIPKYGLLERVKEINKLLENKEHDERTKLEIELQLVTREKILHKWRSRTTTNYKNNVSVMKNADIRKLWSKYMNGEEITDEEIMQAKEDEKEEEITIEVKPKKKSMKLAKPAQSQSPPQESTEQKRVRVKSELSALHQTYKTKTSANLGQLFASEPQLWVKYHEVSEQNEASFPKDEIPRNRIIAELNKIQTKRTKHIVDMGCGKAEISLHFKDDTRFNFTNYDHISYDENIVTSCDISCVPDEDNTIDIVILSLAMWGSNCRDYITEAYRILETGGTLYIIEPTKRWSHRDGLFNIVEGTEALELHKLLLEKGFNIVYESIEKFCMFKCVK